ncbi:MAG: hypothetical protein HQL36_08965, partial [Alphaproteobacteria bacterium]|nr:hypothetical protein [Alphaproteobacteria bacterium]
TVTPYAWDYDTVVLAPLLAWRMRDGAWKPWEASALALAVALPLLQPPLTKGLGLPAGPVILLLALWAVSRDAPNPASEN